MALALAAEGVGVCDLDARWNMPIHVDAHIPPGTPKPAVIHYHDRVDHIGQIRPTGVPAVDSAYHRGQRGHGRRLAPRVPQHELWNWRYLTNPDLGSGVGSRGQALADKRTLLASVVDIVQPTSVIDVGCGDGEATRGLTLPGYVGFDLSTESIRRASVGRPDGRYHVGSLVDHADAADLTLCLDVLIHQADATTYRRLVERLMASAHRALLVSGYERPFTATSPMVFFHEPLSATIRASDTAAEIYPVRHDQEITTFLVVKPTTPRHPRDFGVAALEEVIGRHPTPLRLCDLRLTARRTVAFYPDHAPRLWEYPAVAELVESWTAPGATVIDVGAGVTPLAPYLSGRGYVVDTLDPSPHRRAWPPQPDWNEWDYVDYAAAGFARHSWNCTLAELPEDHRYDVAYSVSVIEHLGAAARRELLAELRRRIHPGGLLVLTVDLGRGTDALWNRNRGEEVEEAAVHGTFASLLAELDEAGMVVVGSEAIRDWGDVPVDIGLVVATRP